MIDDVIVAIVSSVFSMAIALLSLWRTSKQREHQQTQEELVDALVQR